MIGFHNVRFPEDVSWRSSGGPQFKTQVFESFRGFEKRNIDWDQPLMRFNVAYGVKTDVQVLNLFSFFNARQGRAHGFRYKNWANCRIQNGAIATGDGLSTRLPMWKFYGFQGARMYKRLRKIVPGSVTNVGVASIGGLVEGTDYNIDYDSGEIALNFAPGYGVPVFAETLEFDEAVRFDSDSLQSVIDGFNTQSLTDIPLIGVKSGFTSGSIFAPNDVASGDDAFYNSVRLILNFDDTDDLSTTIDQSELGMPVVLNNDATLSENSFKHGNGSFNPGASGNIQIGGDPYNVRSLPFSVEAFIQQSLSGSAVQNIIGKWDETGSTRCWTLRYVLATRQLQFVITEDGSTENVVLNFPWTTAQQGTYDYITVDRTPAGWYVMRINGVVVQRAQTNVLVFDTNTPLTVGGLNNLGANQSPYQGLMDSIRVTIGRVRNNSFENIDVPAPYPV